MLSQANDRRNEPESVKDMEDPAFLKYLKERFPDGPARTTKERAEQHRLAQASRLIRLYREWRAGQK